MPALQALAGVPSFQGQLGQALGTGLSQGIGSSLSSFLEQKKQNLHGTALAEYLGQPEMASALGSLPKEIQIEIARGHIRNKQDNAISRENGIRSIDEMRQIIDRGHTGKNFFNYLTEEGRGDRAALDTSALNLEKLAADMVGKGTLNRQRFEFLKERLPSSWKTDAENRAILDEWEKILNQGETSKNPTPSKKADSNDFVLMKDPKGVIRKIPKSQALNAQEAGGKLVQ